MPISLSSEPVIDFAIRPENVRALDLRQINVDAAENYSPSRQVLIVDNHKPTGSRDTVVVIHDQGRPGLNRDLRDFILSERSATDRRYLQRKRIDCAIHRYQVAFHLLGQKLQPIPLSNLKRPISHPEDSGTKPVRFDWALVDGRCQMSPLDKN